MSEEIKPVKPCVKCGAMDRDNLGAYRPCKKARQAKYREKNREKDKAHVSPWSIKNGRVVFQQGASLSAGELATIITQLTK